MVIVTLLAYVFCIRQHSNNICYEFPDIINISFDTKCELLALLICDI